jgi:hypothetical protein
MRAPSLQLNLRITTKRAAFGLRPNGSGGILSVEAQRPLWPALDTVLNPAFTG